MSFQVNVVYKMGTYYFNPENEYYGKFYVKTQLNLDQLIWDHLMINSS